jgi:hypothetical protein
MKYFQESRVQDLCHSCNVGVPGCDLSFRKVPHIGNDSDAQRNAFSGEARRRETGDQSCAIAVPTPKVGASLTSPLDNG